MSEHTANPDPDAPVAVALLGTSIPVVALVVGLVVLLACVAVMAQALPAVDRPTWFRRGATSVAPEVAEPARLAVTGRRPALAAAPAEPALAPARPTARPVARAVTRPITPPARQGAPAPDAPRHDPGARVTLRTIAELRDEDPERLARAIRLLLEEREPDEGAIT